MIRTNAIITKTNQTAQAYNGNSINFLGEVSVEVFYNNCTFYHKFFVVPDNFRSLLGRDLMSKCNIDIALPATNAFPSANINILSSFNHYLSDSFKSNVNTTVHLDINNDAKPKFMKARSVPIKLQDKVEKELKRLEAHGILEKVYDSKWASPIVCVLKKNDEIRICADYSSTYC